MDFNEKLIQLRKEKQWTQEQLAETLYVSRTAISKWESGRGYPSIDSLRAISGLFHVSIDDLLSNEELIRAAEEDNRERAEHICDLIFGVFDCMLALLLFLPFFGQPESGGVRHMSLLTLETAPILRIFFLSYVAIIVLFGVAELALQNWENRFWRKRTAISLSLSVCGVMLFLASVNSFAYAAVLVFCLLVIKAILLFKQR